MGREYRATVVHIDDGCAASPSGPGRLTPLELAQLSSPIPRDLRDISNSRRCASLRSDRDSTALFPNCAVSNQGGIAHSPHFLLDQFESLHGVHRRCTVAFVNPNSDAVGLPRFRCLFSHVHQNAQGLLQGFTGTIVPLGPRYGTATY